MANGYIPAEVERGCDPCRPTRVEQKAFLGGVLGIDVNGERQPISEAGIVDLTFIEEETREAAEQAIASAQAAAESEQTASEAAASARSSESAAQTAANAAEAAKADAEDAARSANSSKNTAESHASAAQSAAAAAQTADGNAERSAGSAIAAAAQAASSAGAAQQYANEAYNSASAARAASGAAQDAQTAAEASASTASSAAATASQAATDAQAAQSSAEAAQSAAASSATAASGSATAAAGSAAQAAASATAASNQYTEVNAEIFDKTFVLPRAYYWAWYVHATGSDNDGKPTTSNNKLYESIKFEGIPSPVTIKVGTNTSNIQIADNINVSSASWGTEIHFAAGAKIRFLVRYNNAAAEVPASVLDYITVNMTQDGFDYFLSHYTITETVGSADRWATYGYYLAENRKGTRMPSENRYGLKYPVYKATHATMRKTTSSSFSVYLFSQTDALQMQTAGSSTSGKVFEITDDFAWCSQSTAQSSMTMYFDASVPIFANGNVGVYNPWFIQTTFGRTASACAHGDYYYYVADDTSVGLRKIDKTTLSVVETYPINSTQVGHANGSNLIGDNWYISDWYDPDVCHVISLADDSPVVGTDIEIPVSKYFPSVDRGMIYMVSDREAYTLSWDTVDADTSAALIFAKWIKTVGAWKLADKKLLPIFGIVQDIAIYDDVMYVPLSKSANPNRYAWAATYLYHVPTGKSALCNCTQRTECEAVFADDGVIKVVLSDGQMCVLTQSTTDWSDKPVLTIGNVAYDALNA